MTDRNSAVLVVEDYEPLRSLCATVLRRSGYRTLEASTVEIGIDLLRSTEDLGAVITDLNLAADRDGLEIVDLVRERHPDVGLVVMTGMADEFQPESGANEVVLQKPFDISTLADTLATVLPDLT